MIKAVDLGKEIVVTADNTVGLMAHVSRVLADHGINIEGVAGYAAENKAKLMFVVNDTLRAREAIVKEGFADTKESEIVIVDLEHRPGALKSMTTKLAQEKIDIRYMYGTACPAGCPARVIIATNENERAVVSLKK